MKTPPAESNRNAEIELLRFFFAVMVYLSHMNVLPNGALAVDFFFLLTGYLTMASIQKSSQKGIASRSTFCFIFHKIKSFYPELLVATFISVFVYFISKSCDLGLIKGAATTTINGIVPILKMTGLGISVTDFNGATWYLASMLIGLIVVYPLFVRWGGRSFLFICGVFICGFLCVFHGKLNGVYTFIGFTYEGNIRAVGELMIGGATFNVIRELSRARLTFYSAVLISLTKYAAVLVLVALSIVQNTTYHGVALCAAIVVLITVFSGRGADAKLFNNKVCVFLGALSLPLYLGHRAITVCAEQLMPWANSTLMEKTVICFIYSILSALIIMGVGALLRKKSAGIIRAFVCESSN